MPNYEEMTESELRQELKTICKELEEVSGGGDNEFGGVLKFYLITKNYSLNDGRPNKRDICTLAVADEYKPRSEQPYKFAKFFAESIFGPKVRFVMGAFHSGAIVDPYWSIQEIDEQEEVDVLIKTRTCSNIPHVRASSRLQSINDIHHYKEG